MLCSRVSVFTFYSIFSSPMYTNFSTLFSLLIFILYNNLFKLSNSNVVMLLINFLYAFFFLFLDISC